ncbi:hypothetical protein GUJ93_ZPchr0010g9138 [Zizania palustris]|uniref:Uncharacterized protein n=1 Tax=Zizania palustris TaxID=103762 RepID=A0A8J6BRY4_ZIZPA|nr:hypothetical protein GUJ93_ZPchr0010g9138 [Zizania palustris]
MGLYPPRVSNSLELKNQSSYLLFHFPVLSSAFLLLESPPLDCSSYVRLLHECFPWVCRHTSTPAGLIFHGNCSHRRLHQTNSGVLVLCSMRSHFGTGDGRIRARGFTTWWKRHCDLFLIYLFIADFPKRNTHKKGTDGGSYDSNQHDSSTFITGKPKTRFFRKALKDYRRENKNSNDEEIVIKKGKDKDDPVGLCFMAFGDRSKTRSHHSRRSRKSV